MDYIGGKIGDLKKKYEPILPLFVFIYNVNASKCVNFGYKDGLNTRQEWRFQQVRKNWLWITRNIHQKLRIQIKIEVFDGNIGAQYINRNGQDA